MKITQYIIVKGKKISSYSNFRTYTSRMTKGTPKLDADEVAVKVSLELPEALFDKPTLEANIEVPKEVVSKPVIDASMVDNVQDIIKQNTGFDVRLEVVDNEEEERRADLSREANRDRGSDTASSGRRRGAHASNLPVDTTGE